MNQLAGSAPAGAIRQSFAGQPIVAISSALVASPNAG